MNKDKDNKDNYEEESNEEDEFFEKLNELFAELSYEYKDEINEYIDKYINEYEEDIDEYEEEIDDYEEDYFNENEEVYHDEETSTQITDSPLYMVYEKYDLKDSELPSPNDENNYYEFFEEMYKKEKYMKYLAYGEDFSKQFSVFFKFNSTNFWQIYHITSSDINDDKVMITKKRIRKINNN